MRQRSALIGDIVFVPLRGDQMEIPNEIHCISSDKFLTKSLKYSCIYEAITHLQSQRVLCQVIWR